MTISADRSRVVEFLVVGKVFLLANNAIRLVIISKFWYVVLSRIGIKLFFAEKRQVSGV